MTGPPCKYISPPEGQPHGKEVTAQINILLNSVFHGGRTLG